ncbi:MAG: VirB3 family type IV secretion system protein [Treponema sp.]|jgi:type IV secretory pathway TrbD component|nr:VirB3 family type IV secretion system protein [Treponema sp.]
MTLQDYTLPVHKSMHQPDLLMGIPKEVMMIIGCLTIIVIYLFDFWFVFLGVILYVPCYAISKHDPLLLTMAIDSLFQTEHLEG